MKQIGILIAGIVLVIAIVIGISATGFLTLNQEKEDIDLGILLPLSGDAGAYGEEMKYIFDYTIKEINNKDGINNQKIKAIYEDTKCDGKEAVNALNKLININNIKVTTGWMCSGAVLSASHIAENNKIIILSSGAGSPEVSFAGEYTFRNFPSADLAGKKLSEVAINNNHNKISIISENTDYAIGFYKKFKEEFEGKKGKITSYNTFESEEKDFKTMLLKINTQDTDALFISVQTVVSLSNILKNIRELNIKKPIYFTEHITEEVLENFKEIIEGGIFVEAELERTEEFINLKRNIEEEYNFEFKELPEYYIASSYDAVYILKEVIEKCKGVNTECIKDELYSIKNRKGMTGNISMNQYGDVDVDFTIKVIRDGKIENLN
ncbi:MAG: ABC transporter substrate-binding protein [Candidatus Nanoarchaeia archaeon]|nr:ABC transporter substrate-binding protein [Candidatus Nanoarchaeia archaeon]